MSKLIRAVFDTNVFVSSFFGGYPGKAVELWIKGKIILCLTPPIIDEYTEVLKRMGLEEELKELLDLFAKGYNVAFTNRTPELNIIQEDPADNRFIEAAVALKAEYIVSGDKHLKSIGNYMGIEILPPKVFCQRVGFSTAKED